MYPADDNVFRRKTRRRLIVIGVSAFLLLIIITAITTVLVINHSSIPHQPSSPQFPISTSSLKSFCAVTLYPDSCYASLSAASPAAIADPTSLFNLSLSAASLSLSKISSFLSTLDIHAVENRLRAAVLDCRELIDDAIDRFHESASVLAVANPGERIIEDLKTWLSAAIADQETCLEGFEGTSGGFKEKVEAAMANSTRLASNSLAIVSRVLEKFHVPIGRKLIVSEWQRRVLAAGEEFANVTVAKDGSGMVEGVQEAVDMAPKRNLKAFVIYVKAGEYQETVVVDRDKWNVVMIGEGMNKTIITSGKNFVDGTPTFSTATFGEFVLSG